MSELHVVALSGGKDSTAMALMLSAAYPQPYTYICTPTGDELPEMWAHWRHIGELLGSHIHPVMGGTLTGLIEQFGALPNWRQRWCTRLLKIEPYAAWLMQQTKQYDRVISYVGLRADEEEREGGDYSMVAGVESRFPLREWGWTVEDVWGYLDMMGVSIPQRTDCGRCFFQTIGEWNVLWKDHPAVYADAERQEEEVGHTFRSPSRDTWPAGLKELRGEFERGRPIRGAKSDLLAAHKCRVCRI